MEKKPSLAGRLVSTTSKETRIANLSRYFIFENQSRYVQLINRCWSIHKLTFYCLGNHNWSKLSQVRNWFDQSLTFQLYCTYLQNATLRKKKTPKAQNRTAASFYAFTYAQQDSERPSNAAKTLSWIFFEARKQYFATVTTTGADNKSEPIRMCLCRDSFVKSWDSQRDVGPNFRYQSSFMELLFIRSKFCDWQEFTCS